MRRPRYHAKEGARLVELPVQAIEKKLEPNQSQTEAKLKPNQSQTEAEPEPNRSQLNQTHFETRAGTGAELEPNRSQTRAKLGTKLEPNLGLLDLSALQRKALDHFFTSCRVNGSRLTEPVLISALAGSLKSTPAAIKKAIQRIEGRGLALRYRSKAGRGGWTIYELPEPVYKELTFRETRAELEPNRSQTRAKLEPQLEPKPEPNAPSSSSYIDSNFKPTTTAETRARAEDEWTLEDLDYSMLTDIGFGRSQAMQLRNLGLSLGVVQRSLVHFEFELRYTPSGKTIQEPLALLMKRMRQNGYWDAPEEYTKRRAHFQTRFEAQERQRQGGESTGEVGGDNPVTPDVTIPPTDTEQSQPWR